MPKSILYDSLLVHYLARELSEHLVARRLRAVRFDGDERRVILELDDHRLLWELHPARGWLRRAPGRSGSDTEEADVAAEGWGGRRVRTQRRPRVRGLRALPDDRLIEMDIDAGGGGRASRFVFELLTNQWNAIALDPAGTIVAVLWSRDAGGRLLQTGATYEPPGAAGARAGVEEPVSLERFRDLLLDVPEGNRGRALVRELAWTSSLNAGAILGEGGSSGVPVATAYDRYAALAARPAPDPGVLRVRGGQPYPLPLPGVDRRPADSLLSAFDAAAASDAPAGLAPEVRSALEDGLARVARKADALAREAQSAPAKAAELRATADLLMARLHQVPRGADQVELEDFEGGTRVVELDPALSPAANAEALYDRARKRDRAAARLPERVQAARAEKDRLASLLAELEDGSADPAEVARWVEVVRPRESGADDSTERLPYRSYRSSGGLEIRVGRSGRANDELTFHHSAPHDVWLHARDVAGAHVILRWPERDQNPPRRDLIEAATLAALHSKARTSAAVPVDWTRRKYVRSPRKAPPGVVLPDRVTTLFVEPDPAVEARLRP